MENPRVCVAFLCHDGKGNVLLGQRSRFAKDQPLKWEHGAGSIEFGHTIEHTLRKEIREEYGTHVLDYRVLGFREVLRETSQGMSHWVCIDVVAQIDPLCVANTEVDPTTREPVLYQIVWFKVELNPASPWENLPLGEMFSPCPEFLDKYRSELFGHIYHHILMS